MLRCVEIERERGGKRKKSARERERKTGGKKLTFSCCYSSDFENHFKKRRSEDETPHPPKVVYEW